MSQENSLRVGTPPKFDRLILIQTLVHEHPGTHPTVVDCKGAIPLKYEAQPYKRRKSIGLDWEKLDIGWIEPNEVGWIAIENLEGKNLTQQPTKEETDQIAMRNLHIAIGSLNSDHFLIVPPKLCTILHPSDASQIYIRASSHKTSIEITVFTK